MTEHLHPPTSETHSYVSLVSTPHGHAVRLATEEDLKLLIHLQRKYRDECGFAPKGALLDRIATQRIVVVETGGIPSGWISFTHRLDTRTHVSQMAIDEQVWRQQAGSDVVNFLIAGATARGQCAVTLQSAVDLDCNLFWPTLGFRPIGERQGHSRRLIQWAKLLRPMHLDDVRPPHRRQLAYSTRRANP